MITDITSQEASPVNGIAAPQHITTYHKNLITRMNSILALARLARKKGLDPSLEPEIEPAMDLADRVQLMLGISIADHLRNLLREHTTEFVALKVAGEIADGKFGYLAKEAAIDLGIRVGLAIITDGVTIAPIQGISEVSLKNNDTGSQYICISFAGPIRSAGGTEAAFTLVIADYLRAKLGLDRYRVNYAGEDEVGRFIEELRIYERTKGAFQFKVSDEDVEYTLTHIPVEIDGVKTDDIDVVVHRGLTRIKTDGLRGGALRVLNDGVIGRARKLLKVVTDVEVQGWEWLEKLKPQPLSSEDNATTSHLGDVISGRAVLSSANREGGFRLTYGRSFNTGLSTVGIHPAVAVLLDYPVVTGTQIKLSSPGKAATIALVDTLEGPIVRLKDGSVKRINSVEEALSLVGRVESILYMGDLLVSFGDFLENNTNLLPSAYTSSWWLCDLKEGLASGKFDTNLTITLPDLNKPQSVAWVASLSEALTLSRTLHIPLHPKYTHHWDALNVIELTTLRQSLKPHMGDTNVLVAPRTIKKILEKLGVEHQLEGQNIIITGADAQILSAILNFEAEEPSDNKNTLSLLESLSGIKIMPKTGTVIAVRVGRPEKAMPRRMKPPVHVLFPIGKSRNPTRDIIHAAEHEVAVELLNSHCRECGVYTTSHICTKCGGNVVIERVCPSCGKHITSAICPTCKVAPLPFSNQKVNLYQMLKDAQNSVRAIPTRPFKGVRTLMNATKTPEPLEKGILRNKYSIFVYKDGTARFDATNLPMTHFRPKDIGTSPSQLVELGYRYDVDGNRLQKEDQLVELLPQDVVLPQNCGDYFLNVARFIDELLVNYYKLEPYYNCKSREDLIGHLILGLAPHTSVAILGRVIGYTPAHACLAHPYWHSAKRRDCDGDGDSVMLLLDALLNFSKEYLPAQIGGLMDAPLLLQPLVIPSELQRQAHNFDIASTYPKEFYEATLRNATPKELIGVIETVRDRLKTEGQFTGLGFTHNTTLINLPHNRSSYSTLRTFSEKLEKQMEVALKIRAVDANQVASSILQTHIIPDLIGNIRAYSTQIFRCKVCSRRYRRPPIIGKCLSCEGELQATVTRGAVEKYLSVAKDLATRFQIDPYLRARLNKIVEEIEETFPATEGGSQTTLKTFMEPDALA